MSTSTPTSRASTSSRAGLPEAFQHRLSRVLRHYGVTDLERTPELEDAVFRIFHQRRASAIVAVVTAVLRRWLIEPPPGEPLRETSGLTLEHLIAATQLRFPAVSDLARSVVFRWFAQPMLRRSRAQVYAAVRKNLRYLDEHPDAPDRAQRIAAMVASSEPLVRLLGQRIGREGAGLGPMLEVLTRRYYGSKSLRDLRASEVASGTLVVAEHDDENGRYAVLTTAVDFLALGQAVRAIAEASPTDDLADDLVADIYLTWADQPDDADDMAARLREVLAARCHLPAWLRRVTAIVALAQRRGHASPLHVPAGTGPDHRAAADPGPAPADRRADAAGAAPRVRPHPAALGRRGRGVPVQLRRPEEPGRRAAGRRPGA